MATVISLESPGVGLYLAGRERDRLNQIQAQQMAMQQREQQQREQQIKAQQQTQQAELQLRQQQLAQQKEYQQQQIARQYNDTDVRQRIAEMTDSTRQRGQDMGQNRAAATDAARQLQLDIAEKRANTAKQLGYGQLAERIIHNATTEDQTDRQITAREADAKRRAASGQMRQEHVMAITQAKAQVAAARTYRDQAANALNSALQDPIRRYDRSLIDNLQKSVDDAYAKVHAANQNVLSVMDALAPSQRAPEGQPTQPQQSMQPMMPIQQPAGQAGQAPSPATMAPQQSAPPTSQSTAIEEQEAFGQILPLVGGDQDKAWTETLRMLLRNGKTVLSNGTPIQAALAQPTQQQAPAYGGQPAQEQQQQSTQFPTAMPDGSALPVGKKIRDRATGMIYQWNGRAWEVMG